VKRLALGLDRQLADPCAGGFPGCRPPHWRMFRYRGHNWDASVIRGIFRVRNVIFRVRNVFAEFVRTRKIPLITLASQHAATISLDSSLKRAERHLSKMKTTCTFPICNLFHL
jgi:hypothetical protein